MNFDENFISREFQSEITDMVVGRPLFSNLVSVCLKMSDLLPMQGVIYFIVILQEKELFGDADCDDVPTLARRPGIWG